MPRPKGSKNKSTLEIIENAEEKIAQLEAEIEKLTSDLKAKKDELKAIVKAKAEADKAAASTDERLTDEDVFSSIRERINGYK